MTHFSGLRPDLDLTPPWSGYETGIQKALHDKPAGPPGVRFVYSDINFILTRRDRPSRQRQNAERLRARARLRAHRHDAIRGFLPPAVRESAHRAHRNRSRNRAAVPRRGPRRDLALYGRRRRTRRPFHHRGRSREIRANDARHGRGARRNAFSIPLTIRKFTTPQSPAGSAHPARPGLGHRFAVFLESRRVISRSAPTAIPDSPELPSGSTRSRAAT